MAYDDEKSSFRYACISPYSIGGGMRSQKGMNAWDFSAHVIPLIEINAIHLKCSYLHYPNHNGLYIGGGVGALAVFFPEDKGYWIDDTVFPTIEGTAGYQWKTKKRRNLFVELNLTQISAPIIPLPRVTFGLSF